MLVSVTQNRPDHCFGFRHCADGGRRTGEPGKIGIKAPNDVRILRGELPDLSVRVG